jgi:hypothetical protein
MADPKGINPPMAQQGSLTPQDNSQKPRDREEPENTDGDVNAMLSGLTHGLANPPREQLRKVGASPEDHVDGEWYKRPTDEQLREKYAGVIPQHQRHVETDTGLIIDKWIVPNQDNGKSGVWQGTKRTYRADGPATIVTDPKTGVVVEEDYRGSHGPNGREYLKRDTETGVVTMERLREKDGGLTFIQRDRSTGVVISQDKRDKNDKMIEFIAHNADGTVSEEKETNSAGQTVPPPQKMAPNQKPQDFDQKTDKGGKLFGKSQPGIAP